MICKKTCNCFRCQSNKVKRQIKKDNLKKLGVYFEKKTGHIITREDIYNISKQYCKTWKK